MIHVLHDARRDATSAAASLRTLADLRPGEEGVVFDIAADEGLRVRLMELGFLPGGRVQLVRRAPLGCPMEVDLEGARFSLRVETARGVRLASHA